MKKLILIFAALLFTATMHAQIFAAMTPDTAGTIAGMGVGRSHYFTSPAITQGYQAWAVDIYVTTTGTHATDSTNIIIEASEDGTNFFKLTDLGTPWKISTAAYYASTTTATRLSSAGTGAVGWVWKIVSPLPYRYVRAKITQYKDASILTVNRCNLVVVK
jgi:hypothetical protein